MPPPLKAENGREIKAALIGCGHRGAGAAINFLNAGEGLELVAVADLFDDRIQSFRESLKSEKGLEIPDEKCFVGFDAYEKVLDEDINYVIIATPPHFRPVHFEAAVKARKNVFMEKPVAVDPVGARRIMQAGKQGRLKRYDNALQDTGCFLLGDVKPFLVKKRQLTEGTSIDLENLRPEHIAQRLFDEKAERSGRIQHIIVDKTLGRDFRRDRDGHLISSLTCSNFRTGTAVDIRREKTVFGGHSIWS